MEMIKIKWIGGKRTLSCAPGIMENGKVLKVPYQDGVNLVNSGYAEFAENIKKKKEEETKEEETKEDSSGIFNRKKEKKKKK